MTASFDRSPLEEQIAQWRLYVLRRGALHGPEVEDASILTGAGCRAEDGREDPHPSHPPVKPARKRPRLMAGCKRVLFQTSSPR